MKAKYVLLNHFSQRYPKLPRVQPVPVSEQDDPTRSNPKVALAFDLMTLPLKSFDKVAGYTDAMEILFKEEEKEDVNGSGETQGEMTDGKQQKNGKTPKGKNEKSGSELSNSQRRKIERKQQWETKKTSPASPVAGEKRQSGATDDVDTERGTVKRTKSENVILPSESTT
jgi:ribonuclease Z